MPLLDKFGRWFKKDELEDLESPHLSETERTRLIEALNRLNGRCGFYRAFIKELESLVLPLSRAKRGDAVTILDIGAGGGGLLRAIHEWAAQQGIAVALTGLDIDPEFARRSEERFVRMGIRIRFIAGDATVLNSIPDSSYDIVISSHMVHHVRDPLLVARMLSEVKRTARHGWLIVDLDRRGSGVLLMFAALLFGAPWQLARDGIRSVRRAYTPVEVRRCLDQLGEAAADEGFLCRRMRLAPYWKIKGLKNRCPEG